MISNAINISLADTVQKHQSDAVSGSYVTLNDEQFYCIQNYDALSPFFISLVSSANHWLFISTTGGLTAGRIDADHALFPYYTVDKITENTENTGSKTILMVTTGELTQLWEPFSDRLSGVYALERNLYKNVAGTTLIFEEKNLDLAITLRYAWRSSKQFGFVKTAWLVNHNDDAVRVNLLDGVQNILPANISADVQNQFSVLLNAYKRSELHPETGLGMYSLSSRLTDLAEPSESLRANVAWQVGLDNPLHLLSSSQLGRFRRGQALQPEHDIRGERGAYFVQSTFVLPAKQTQEWHIVCDVFQDTAQVVNLTRQIANDPTALKEHVKQDLQANRTALTNIVASADGLQLTADDPSLNHHFANVLFNVMRGGIFADQYQIDTVDLRDFVGIHNQETWQAHRRFFDDLPDLITLQDLKSQLKDLDAPDLIRLCYSYLPLTFSRRHGDPSRPWNRFAIHLRNADGSRRLTYQGNWRDIFQNWEALAYSYPEFIEGMIFTFLNATTFDGYNPYRITRDGIDWEAPEPDNPWANIGYWSDHQIIYLQKLLETCAKFYPEKLQSLLTRPLFASANVPYIIKPYDLLIIDPYDSIEFDEKKQALTEQRVAQKGADGRLVFDDAGQVLHTSLIEKLLNLLLAKLSNFVPEGGLWMNTQRPEWNDANNALAGWGLSVVTVGYLRRYTHFMIALVSDAEADTISVTQNLSQFLESVHRILQDHAHLLESQISDAHRRTIMDALGQAGSQFRQTFYAEGVSGKVAVIDRAELLAFLHLTQDYLDHTLNANKRDDSLYHSYNILRLQEGTASVQNLYEMLEGQVSILSSGLLSSSEALALLGSLRQSALYRTDQHSYILYPNRELNGFLQKNNLTSAEVVGIALIDALEQNGDSRLIVRDVRGDYHFNGEIRNVRDVEAILAELVADSHYTELVSTSREQVLAVFEKTFNHAAFTGRSGTFFAYEGLGSIYWHMVSKLLLAVQECVVAAKANPSDVQGLMAAYYDIRDGLGFNKSPDVYGAFPTDPYSHTPENRGAKQPGMTGMVKEEILTRLGELGAFVNDGILHFDPLLVRVEELLQEPREFVYIDVLGQSRKLALKAGALAFTLCQVPIIMERADTSQIAVTLTDQTTITLEGDRLDRDLTQKLFLRDNTIERIWVSISL